MGKNANNKKANQLGMPIGTASARLRKAVMFDLVVRLGENKCYRCGLPITNPEELSIDHKEDWLDVNPELFWNVKNIAFSHLSCNRPSRIPGGSFRRKICEEGYAWCSSCQAPKPIGDFNKKKTHWNGLHQNCRSCDKKIKHNWRYGGEA